MPEALATPIAALVPNPDPTGPNWIPGLHFVGAERDINRTHLWNYWHAYRNTLWHDSGFCSQQTYRTKREALAAGIAYVKHVYHPCDCPDQPFKAVPGPFQLCEA